MRVTIFAGSGHHFHHMPPDDETIKNGETVDGVDYVWIKTPTAGQGRLFRRVFAWLVFAWRLLLTARQLPRPQTIIHSSPSLLAYISSWALSQRHRAKIIFEFRDVWPATFWMMGGRFRYHPLVLIHALVERFALRFSDHCFSTLPLGSQRLLECGITPDKFTWLPNGQSSAEPSSETSLPSSLKTIMEGDHAILLYTGSMGQANALDVIINTANRVRDLPVHFVLVGEGNRRVALEAMTEEYGLTNVTFHDPVAKSVVPALLDKADALLISWRDLALYRYGTSPNKLPEYFAAGRPVIQAYSGAADVVDMANAGISVAAEDPDAFADAIHRYLSLSPNERVTLGNNGKQYTADNFSFPMIASRCKATIERLHEGT